MRILVSTVLLCAGMITGAAAQVPHTFQSGEPALASEVNENFEALDTRITTNDGRITSNETRITANESAIAGISTGGPQLIVKDANGDTVGEVLTSLYGASEGYWHMVVLSQFEGLSGTIPVVIDLIPLSAGITFELFYESADCTGDPYIYVAPNNFTVDSSLPVMVNPIDGDLYVANGSPDATFTAGSRYYSSPAIGIGQACSTSSLTPFGTAEAVPAQYEGNLYTNHPAPYTVARP